jgi:hypothetical protein
MHFELRVKLSLYSGPITTPFPAFSIMFHNQLSALTMPAGSQFFGDSRSGEAIA